MLSLTRRQLQNLKVEVASQVHGTLVRSRQYRENPQLAAQTAKKHADAAVKVHQKHGAH